MTQGASSIDAEAARWAVRLSAGSLPAEEQGELDRWLAAHPRHQGALLRARAAWLDLDRLAALKRGSAPAALEESPPFRERSIQRRWILAAAVSAVSLAGTGAALWCAADSRGSVYVSDVGEIRRVTLPDGSTLLLNTASEARVRFSKARREIQLVRGEALFEVASNPDRPFLVRTGEVTVQALGTIFAVRARAQRVEVTVTEGVVEVTPEQRTAEAAARRVLASEQAIVERRHKMQVQPIGSQEAERRLAWREGMTDFDGESLSQAVEEINRYNHQRIVVEDATLAGRPVVGVFRANDATGFAATVATALDADVVTDGDVISIKPRSGL